MMGWPVVIFVLVVGGVAAMLATMRGIQRATDELSHDALSVRFWALLGALGLLLVAAFAYPIEANGWFDNRAGVLVVVLMSIPPLFVTVVGVRNAAMLAFALRRRRRALARGALVEARVVERRRRLFAHDIMEVLVEADLPLQQPADEFAYRQRDPSRTRVHRFVETCPADHWARLEPGAAVGLRYEPANLGSYAVLLLRA
ncbi:MAG: hypothetical protein IPH07_26795 [Deltaproteobacteria bacterium]|nr:hypothetical protein [Deltaproteobacteria bacterium]MBK8718368.1 hypothetical protein [Deltaproteobacteria bacterium]MBP7290385.1 hypothetical protein [Nannocystaceae bacterium]